MRRPNLRIKNTTFELPSMAGSLYFAAKMLVFYQDRQGYIPEVILQSILIFIVSFVLSVVLEL